MGYLSKQMRRILPVGVAHDHGHGARRNFAVARDGADVSDLGRQRGQNAVFVDAKRRRSVFGAAEKLDAAARKRVGIDRAAPLDGKKTVSPTQSSIDCGDKISSETADSEKQPHNRTTVKHNAAKNLWRERIFISVFPKNKKRRLFILAIAFIINNNGVSRKDREALCSDFLPI